MKMKLNLYILGESKKLGLNNEHVTVEEIQAKLNEEVEEVHFEAEKMRYYAEIKSDKYYEARNRFGQELLDLIQISIAGIFMLVKDGMDMRILIFRHNRKLLVSRGWKALKKIGIEIENIK